MKSATRIAGKRIRFRAVPIRSFSIRSFSLWAIPFGVALSLGAMLTGASGARAAQPVLLEHATIIDGTGRAPLADAHC